MIFRSKIKVNLTENLYNETIFQDSYWVFRGHLMPCLTLNSPIDKLVTHHGDNINVS